MEKSNFKFHTFEQNQDDNEIDKNSEITNNIFNPNMIKSNSFYQMNNIDKRNLIKKTLSIDFLNEIKNKNFETIQTILPHLLNNIFDDESEDFNLLVGKYQKILIYLYDIQIAMNEKNQELEFNYNQNQHTINKIKHNELVIGNLSNKIKETQEKLNKIKIFLKKNNKKIPESLTGINKNHKNIYFCDICPNIKFTNYESFHNHYVKKHIDPNLDYGVNIFKMNNYFDQVYFDLKLKEFSNDVKNQINSLKRQKEEEIDRNNDKMKNKIAQSINLSNNNNQNLLKSINPRNSLRQSKNIYVNKRESYKKRINNKEFYDKIEQFKNEQKEKYKKFINDFNIFRDKIYERLNEISKSRKEKQNE